MRRGFVTGVSTEAPSFGQHVHLSDGRWILVGCETVEVTVSVRDQIPRRVDGACRRRNRLMAAVSFLKESSELPVRRYGVCRLVKVIEPAHK